MQLWTTACSNWERPFGRTLERVEHVKAVDPHHEVLRTRLSHPCARSIAPLCDYEEQEVDYGHVSVNSRLGKDGGTQYAYLLGTSK